MTRRAEILAAMLLRGGFTMFWNPKRKSSTRYGSPTAFIDESSEIEGKYSFSGTLVLNGRFQGEIVSDDTLIIGERAVVNATIRAGSVVISGEVVGNVQANERIELKGTARLFGDVEAAVVVIEEGVLFEGHSRMTKSRPSEPVRDQAVVPFRR
ncbi:MAG: polymer-forming cytoskeletal protein [Candidatus Methylomirabilia bacterium]